MRCPTGSRWADDLAKRRRVVLGGTLGDRQPTCYFRSKNSRRGPWLLDVFSRSPQSTALRLSSCVGGKDRIGSGGRYGVWDCTSYETQHPTAPKSKQASIEDGASPLARRNPQLPTPPTSNGSSPTLIPISTCVVSVQTWRRSQIPTYVALGVSIRAGLVLLGARLLLPYQRPALLLSSLQLQPVR